MVDQAVEELQPPIAVVVLAAGSSRRLGRPKQTLEFSGETLLERAVRTARAARLLPRLVVLNRSLAMDAALVSRLQRLDAHVLQNNEADEGMGSSVRCGVAELSPASVQGVVLMTCDQVAVTPQHLRALCSVPAKTAASGYAGRVGVPAYFPAQRFEELRALRGDQGARMLLGNARVLATEALALDVDTEEQWTETQAWLRARKR